MEKNRGTLHICMPVYNGERYLNQALESLLNQTYGKYRLFIVDNLSTDGTPDIARAYAKRDERIEYLRQGEWASWPVNWSRSWEIAAPGSEFFMWASDDDLWSPDYIETLLPPLLNRTKTVLSFPHVETIDEKNRIISPWSRDRRPGGGTSLGRIHSIIHCSSYSALYGLFRTDAITLLPAFPDVSFGADLWFLILLAARGKFHYEGGVTFFKRTGGISETGEDPCTVRDPGAVWNIGPAEWEMMNQLPVHFLVKKWAFYQMKTLGKILFRQKKIDWFLYPMFYALLLKRDPRSFGLRKRFRQAWRRLRPQEGTRHEE